MRWLGAFTSSEGGEQQIYKIEKFSLCIFLLLFLSSFLVCCVCCWFNSFGWNSEFIKIENLPFCFQSYRFEFRHGFSTLLTDMVYACYWQNQIKISGIVESRCQFNFRPIKYMHLYKCFIYLYVCVRIIFYFIVECKEIYVNSFKVSVC